MKNEQSASSPAKGRRHTHNPSQLFNLESTLRLALGQLAGSGAFALANDCLGFDTHNTATPLLAVVDVVVEHGSGDRDDLVELRLVLLLDVNQSQSGGGLLVDQVAKTSLALNDDIRNIIFAAESREPDDQLNGIDIVSMTTSLALRFSTR